MTRNERKYKLPPAAEAALALERLRSRKRKLLALLLTALALLAGCAGERGAASGGGRPLGVVSVPSGAGRLYFAYADPRDDDKGPGTYRYPTSFENREGYLDIVSFRVEDGGSNVIFRISCRRPIPRRRDDGSTEAKGWWLQLFDIYIDKDHVKGSGQTRALPGRHVRFSPESAWEQVVLVTPNYSRTVEKMLEERTSDMNLVHVRNKVIVPHRAYAQGYEFVVYVPKFRIGTPRPGWGYQVLALPYDERNLSYGQFQNGEVVKFPDETHFGGGSDYRGDPNVIDMLAPSASEQYRILGDYRSSPYSGDDRWPVIGCVYATSLPPSGERGRKPVVYAAPGVTRSPDTEAVLRQGGFSPSVQGAVTRSSEAGFAGSGGTGVSSPSPVSRNESAGGGALSSRGGPSSADKTRKEVYSFEGGF